jgi:hypothetical protein
MGDHGMTNVSKCLRENFCLKQLDASFACA